MAPAARPHQLPEFAFKFVRARARALARRGIIPAYERSDIEQHLLLELWRRWGRFDSSRGGLPGFVARVIDNAVADLIKHQAADRHGGPLRLVSLDDQVCDEDGNLTTIGDGLPADTALWPAPSTDLDAADLRVDLGRTIACLPRCLQDLCRRLSCQPIAQIARETGTSRHSIYVSLATIRRQFLEAGLHLYLADGPTLSSAPR